MMARTGNLGIGAVAVAVASAFALQAAPALADDPAGPPQHSEPLAPADPTPGPITGVARDGGQLAGDPGPQGDLTDVLTSEWLRCDAAGGACQHTNDVDLTYDLAPADVGSTIRLRVRRTDALMDYSEADSAPTSVVDAQAPVNTGAPPSFTGPARDGSTLVGADPAGQWTGTPPISFSYLWLRCGADGAACALIPGAATRYHTLTAADVGRRVEFVVVATGPEASIFKASPPSVVVAGVAPFNLVSPAFSGAPRVGRLLTARHGLWAGTGPFAYAYEWQRCAGACRPTGATGRTYRPRAADAGKRLLLVVTARNAWGRGFAGVLSVLVAPASGKAPALSGRLLSPFPVVIFSGRFTRAGAVITELRVSHAPRGARVTVICRGRGCPYRRKTLRVRRGRVRFHALQRSLPAGTSVDVLVRKGRLLGKYTSFRVRRGAAPGRRDGCLRPGSSRPGRCPVH